MHSLELRAIRSGSNGCSSELRAVGRCNPDNFRSSSGRNLPGARTNSRSIAFGVCAEGRALPERGCALCLAQPPHTPTDAACGHQFCYYCVTAACMADAHARCPRCDAKLSVPPAPVGTGSGTTKP